MIAAYIQLARGTKYSRFPNWLDRWMKMRKQLGLLMLFSAAMHVSLSENLSSTADWTLVSWSKYVQMPLSANWSGILVGNRKGAEY